MRSLDVGLATSLAHNGLRWPRRFLMATAGQEKSFCTFELVSLFRGLPPGGGGTMPRPYPPSPGSICRLFSAHPFCMLLKFLFLCFCFGFVFPPLVFPFVFGRKNFCAVVKVFQLQLLLLLPLFLFPSPSCCWLLFYFICSPVKFSLLLTV